MLTHARSNAQNHFQCVGVGVGPANLSLASLLHGSHDISNKFIEKRPSFGWHDGQQIDGATLQVSMLKDLVTLSDPTNEFSFLSYLHSQGRLYHFINAQFDAIPRREFRNYMAWASHRNQNIVFGEEVLSIEFDGTFVVHTSRETVTADNISVGVGTQPWFPQHARDAVGDTQFHVSDFTAKGRDLGGKRVAVIGGGQSGAEAFLDLISRPERELPRRAMWISRRANYFPIDDTPFTNDYYMPSFSDYFFQLDRATRERFNGQNVLTSDGISESTLREIYQRAYVHRFINRDVDLFSLCPNREVMQVTNNNGEMEIMIAHNDVPGSLETAEADVIIWATGFRSARMDFLAPLAHRIEREGDEYKIDDSFAVQWDGPPDKNIFVQNATRQQRGLADPNLSLIAWRARRIMDRICGAQSDTHAASFIEWSAKPRPEFRGELAQ